MAVTTIQVSVEVRDELRLRGRMGESYDDVIRRLLRATPARGPPSGEYVLQPLSPTSHTLFPRRELR